MQLYHILSLHRGYVDTRCHTIKNMVMSSIIQLNTPAVVVSTIRVQHAIMLLVNLKICNSSSSSGLQGMHLLMGGVLI